MISENNLKKITGEIRDFLNKNPSLSVGGINDESQLPRRKLEMILKEKRSLTLENYYSLSPILKKYGFKGGNVNKTKIIAIANHKGGVGKTTTTAGFSEALAQKGNRVLMIDFDPQGNLSQIMGYNMPDKTISDCLFNDDPLPIKKIAENLYLCPNDISLAQIEIDLLTKVGGDVRLKYKLEEIQDNYEFIIIDCPPSLNKLTVSALYAASSVVITMQPEASSMKGLSSLLERIKEVKQHINREMRVDGILFTLVKNNSVHEAYKSTLLASYGTEYYIFDSQIKQSVDIQKSQSAQVPLGVYNKKSEAYKSYQEFCNEYLNK